MRVGFAVCSFVFSLAGPTALRAEPATETVEQALCRLIETSAHIHAVPQGFLTRLIWREGVPSAEVDALMRAKDAPESGDCPPATGDNGDLAFVICA